MDKFEAVEKIHTELGTGIQLTKCQQCGCMRGALDAFAEQLPGIEEEGANLLAQQIVAWSGSMKDIRYTCLGCEHCYPAVAENAFSQAFPGATLETALVCGFQPNQENWPAVIGEYFVVDKTAQVAVSTLGSVQLAETLAKMNLPGLAIVGKTETENIGIDKIIKNITTNPSIKFLVVAGRDPLGHQSGDALVALAQNGVDDKSRVVGATGKRPILRNVSHNEIEAFRKQVQVVDLRGCEDPAKIGVRVTELAGKIAEPYNCEGTFNDGVSLNTPIPVAISQSDAAEIDCDDPQCACHAQSKTPVQSEVAETECADPQCACHAQTTALPQTLVASDFDQNIPLDRAGYFVILPIADRNIVNVEHYGYDNTLLHVIEGPNARALYLSIIREGWVTDLNHAAYLGKELAKAELALRLGINYVQDGA